ncbi:MAG TPA: hypothetical protein VLZ05_28670 [Mycobacterium sp.]|nr:hypothetical protein [Mycobacterium sp.]HUH72467.1 hypothetical protein [Mycobacterium sp.]
MRHVNGDAARRLARIGEIIAKAKDSRAAPIQVLSWVRKALDAQVPISEQMTWNFCPECGHPVYQHNGEGCQHVDEALKACEDAECEQRGEHVHLVPEKCDCTWAHQLPVGV